MFLKGRKRLRRELDAGLAAVRRSLEEAIDRGEQFSITQEATVLDAGASPLGGRSFVRAPGRTITITYGPGPH